MGYPLIRLYLSTDYKGSRGQKFLQPIPPLVVVIKTRVTETAGLHKPVLISLGSTLANLCS